MATEVFSAEAGSVSKGPESKAKATAILEKFKLPTILFPLATIDEFGFNESNGLMWMKQPGRSQKEFPDAEIVVHHGRTVHGYAESLSVKKLVGFKVKDLKEKNLFLSIPYREIKVDGDEIMLLSDQGDPRAFSASLLRAVAEAGNVPTAPRAVAPPHGAVAPRPMSLVTSPKPVDARPPSFNARPASLLASSFAPIAVASTPSAVAARSTSIAIPSTPGDLAP